MVKATVCKTVFMSDVLSGVEAFEPHPCLKLREYVNVGELIWSVKLVRKLNRFESYYSHKMHPSMV